MSDTFTFTYSPKQREEIEAIRQKYTDATENKMDELRRIDARVTSRATVCSVAIGIAGVTAVSFGVTTIFKWGNNALGIVLCAVGLCVMTLTMLLHGSILRFFRKRAAPHVIALSDELLGK